jgi:hypothetical protein
VPGGPHTAKAGLVAAALAASCIGQSTLKIPIPDEASPLGLVVAVESNGALALTAVDPAAPASLPELTGSENKPVHVTALAYRATLDELCLQPGPIDVARPGDAPRPLPRASAVYQLDLDGHGAPDWQSGEPLDALVSGVRLPSGPGACNACGHDCGAGACSAGVCSSYVLAPGVAYAEVIVAAASPSHDVFFTTRTSSVIRADKRGSNAVPPMTLYRNLQVPPFGLAIGSGRLFLTECDDSSSRTGFVDAIGFDGSGFQRASDMFACPVALAFDGSTLFVLTRWDTRVILALDPVSLDSREVVSGPTRPSGDAVNLAVDPGPGGSVYWSATDAVYRVAKDGTGLTVIARPGGGGLGIDASYVYWADLFGQIHRAPKIGDCASIAGCPETIATDDTGAVDRLAVDDSGIFWLTFAPSHLIQADKDGTHQRTLASSLYQAHGLALDDGFVYITQEAGQGNVLGIAKQ